MSESYLEFLVSERDMDRYESENKRVTIEIHDWNEEGKIDVIVMGTIIARVLEPSGYNVKLDSPRTFTGHVPIPIGYSGMIYKLFTTKGVVLDTIFVRDFDVTFADDIAGKVGRYICNFFQNSLTFRIVSAVFPPDSKSKTSHILYYHPDGKIRAVVDDVPVLKQFPEHGPRLVYKHEHFYGFSSEIDGISTKALYFTSNRYATIELLEEIKWGDIRQYPMKPSVGTVICGVSSGKINGNSESMDQWFICSEQFKLLVDLCLQRKKISLKKAVENLIIPHNKDNMPPKGENPQHRYLYAGIWLLMNRQPIPEFFNLPKKANEPFEVWWPRQICSFF